MSDSPVESHWSARLAMVMYHAEQAGTGKTLLLGDSLTEGFYPSTVGGYKVVNAGFGWGRIDTIAARAETIATHARPKICHLMIGGNDVPIGPSATIASDLDAIFAPFKQWGTKFVVWPVNPVRSDKGSTYPLANRAAINNYLAAAASRNGALWDWHWVQTITNGTHKPGVVTDNWGISGTFQSDGLHWKGTTHVSRASRIDVWRTTIRDKFRIDPS